MEWLKHKLELRRLRRQMEVEQLEREFAKRTCPHNYTLVHTSREFNFKGNICTFYHVYCPVCESKRTLEAHDYAILINSQTKRNEYYESEESSHGEAEKSIGSW